MCGLVGYFGNVDQTLVQRLVYESGVRGLHHFGKAIAPAEEAGIFHARYCTSGETNQPLKIGNRFMAFNGVIHMGTKEEMELEYGIEMDTDNDGEVILRLCKDAQEVISFLKTTKATFAGLWLEPGRLTALRNAGRPLWKHESVDGVYLASTRDIFNRAGIYESLTELNPLETYEWTF